MQSILKSFETFKRFDAKNTNPTNKKTDFEIGLCFKWWEVGEEILTNHAYDIYEMSPYLMEMKTLLNEIDSRKYTS